MVKERKENSFLEGISEKPEDPRPPAGKDPGRSPAEGADTRKSRDPLLPERQPSSSSSSETEDLLQPPVVPVPSYSPLDIDKLTKILTEPAFRSASNPITYLAKKLKLAPPVVLSMLGDSEVQTAMASVLTVEIFALIQPVLQRLKEIAMSPSVETKDSIAAAKLLLTHITNLVDSGDVLKVRKSGPNGAVSMAAELRRKKKTGGRRV